MPSYHLRRNLETIIVACSNYQKVLINRQTIRRKQATSQMQRLKIHSQGKLHNDLQWHFPPLFILLPSLPDRFSSLRRWPFSQFVRVRWETTINESHDFVNNTSSLMISVRPLLNFSQVFLKKRILCISSWWRLVNIIKMPVKINREKMASSS